MCKFEGTQIVLDSTGVEYEEFKDKFTGESFNKSYKMLKLELGGGGGIPETPKKNPRSKCSHHLKFHLSLETFHAKSKQNVITQVMT